MMIRKILILSALAALASFSSAAPANATGALGYCNGTKIGNGAWNSSTAWADALALCAATPGTTCCEVRPPSAWPAAAGSVGAYNGPAVAQFNTTGIAACSYPSGCSTPVNGSCGTANGGSFASAPTTNLCGAGNGVATPSPSGSGPWTWTCGGSGGGSPSGNCTATQTAPPSCVWTYSGGVTSGCGAYTDCSSNTESSVTGTACSTAGAQCFGGNRMMCIGFKETCVCGTPVNGTCGTSNGGTFASTPSSNLCGNGNGVATPAPSGSGPWTWTCGGSGGGSASGNCTASQTASPVNGVCSGTAGACTTGTVAGDNGLTSCGTTRTWNCNGSGGGTNAPCTFVNAACTVNGACGSADGLGVYSAPASNLCTVGGASAVAGAGPFTWTCAGSGGGSTASCSAPLSQDGACGTSHNGNFYVAPAANLCAVGTPSAVAGTGPWTWTCGGVSGGSNASCNANKSVNGVCGVANGVSSETSPAAGLCSAGNSTAVTNSSNTWNWNCNGTFGGASATCSAPQQINGTCGPANGSSVYTKPTSSLCATGNSTSVSGTGPFDWNCNGINGGTNATCSANLVVNGECGAAHGAYSSTAPTTGLCSAGTDTVVAGLGPFTWSCNGLNGGTVIACSSQVVVQGTCGPSNNVPTAVAPAVGLCATGAATAVTGAGPWTWTCTGSGGGVTSTCTAPTPPPPPSFGGACPVAP